MQAVNDALGCFDANVGHDELRFKFFNQVFVDLAITGQVGKVVAQPTVAPVDAGTQPLDKFCFNQSHLWMMNRLHWPDLRMRQRAKRSADKKNRPGRLRIVAGNWRSRLLDIEDAPGLRPTSERIRETLFNWLEPRLRNARCLDLFAGSGALGLEALSRGAAYCVFVENSASAAATLRKNIATLDAVGAEIHEIDAIEYLQGQDKVEFDIVFLDPPFAAVILADLCRLLVERSLLADDSRIYIEEDRSTPAIVLPEGWQTLRTKNAGNVRYSLRKYR